MNWRDLGHGHRYSLTRWSPDRELNPQFEGVPDFDPCGAIVEHLTPTGERCPSGITFNLPGIDRVFVGVPLWELLAVEPLHVEPSILCRACGDHGFIRGGLWVPA